MHSSEDIEIPENEEFPEIDNVIMAVMEEAEKQKLTLSMEYLQGMAMDLANELYIESFDPSEKWLQRIYYKKIIGDQKFDQNSPSLFLQMSFGEKHDIATFMRQHPGLELKEYAEIFTNKWNRNVTER